MKTTKHKWHCINSPSFKFPIKYLKKYSKKYSLHQWNVRKDDTNTQLGWISDYKVGVSRFINTRNGFCMIYSLKGGDWLSYNWVEESFNHLSSLFSNPIITLPHHLITTQMLGLFQKEKWITTTLPYQKCPVEHSVSYSLSFPCLFSNSFYTHSETVFLAFLARGGGKWWMMPLCNL